MPLGDNRRYGERRARLPLTFGAMAGIYRHRRPGDFITDRAALTPARLRKSHRPLPYMSDQDNFTTPVVERLGKVCFTPNSGHRRRLFGRVPELCQDVGGCRKPSGPLANQGAGVPRSRGWWVGGNQLVIVPHEGAPLMSKDEGIDWVKRLRADDWKTAEE